MKENLTNIILKCQNIGIKNIILSGLVISNRVRLDILEKAHAMIFDLCKSYNCLYIDNRNIKGNCLSYDGLHLLETGKSILANNFIFNINKANKGFPRDLPPVGSYVYKIVTALSYLQICSL